MRVVTAVVEMIDQLICVQFSVVVIRLGAEFISFDIVFRLNFLLGRQTFESIGTFVRRNRQSSYSITMREFLFIS